LLDHCLTSAAGASSNRGHAASQLRARPQLWRAKTRGKRICSRSSSLRLCRRCNTYYSPLTASLSTSSLTALGSDFRHGSLLLSWPAPLRGGKVPRKDLGSPVAFPNFGPGLLISGRESAPNDRPARVSILNTTEAFCNNRRLGGRVPDPTNPTRLNECISERPLTDLP
jgi:hypothetical protein